MPAAGQVAPATGTIVSMANAITEGAGAGEAEDARTKVAQQLSDMSTEHDTEAQKEMYFALGGTVESVAAQLNSDVSAGVVDGSDGLKERIAVYGGNYFDEKRLPYYYELVWAGMHDTTIIMLIFCSVLSLIMELSTDHASCTPDRPPAPPTARFAANGTQGNATHDDWRGGGGGVPGWIEPVTIVITVAIVLNVAASIDYRKERLFATLNKELNNSNKKTVVRGGKQCEVTDREIVVGDVLQFNAHMLASIPADGILISGDNVKIDEAALTGEPEPIEKKAKYDGEATPFIKSGTEVKSGSGTMLVIAVGKRSVSGKIKAQVYGDGAAAEEEMSPLFVKLNTLAIQIGKIGILVALLCLVAMCIAGFGIKEKPAGELINYLITAMTVLVVAVPEGLPLAVTLALAFSSYKMMDDNNLVKHLDACETMGSATTICSDKTGTLTANRMTVKQCWSGFGLYAGDTCKDMKAKMHAAVLNLLGHLIAVDTMDATYLEPNADVVGGADFKGNPTECALLVFARDLGFEYAGIRDATAGRSKSTLDQGKAFMFSSARKMMSWVVPAGGDDQPAGGYAVEGGATHRLYVKGASEVVLSRCTHVINAAGAKVALTDDVAGTIKHDVLRKFTGAAMRTLVLAYRDLDAGAEWGEEHGEVKNADGSPALCVECGLTLVAIVAIEDPLRAEVPPAIQQAYRAGIDVRMVTGDNLDTAIAIASQCGILRAEHFDGNFQDPSTRTIKKDRAMEGKEFRSRVHADRNGDGQETFLQDEFDKIWPRLRVLARSSPEDKLTLASGLNKSHLYEDKDVCAELAKEGITIFPDRQVVAMTGDGTNDAPALKRADVGFAMGISGTQIAKDAADIILLDDNFASIVTAAKWGRNVYDSISKFIQFQLTVNITALTVAVVGSVWHQKSPITATQMLWVNLIMDSLASLALATEPPTEEQLKRPPVNRSASIITERMWFNMLGHAFYQVTVLLVLMIEGHTLLGVPDGIAYYEAKCEYSVQYTVIFNTFVLMTLFNEINMRKLRNEFNVFAGIFQNVYFLAILIVTFILQVIAVELGGRYIGCYDDGLTAGQWLVCLGLGAGGLVWHQVINVIAIYGTDVHYFFTNSLGGVLKFGPGKISHGVASTTTLAQRSQERNVQTAFRSASTFSIVE